MTQDTFAQQHNAVKEMGAKQERDRVIAWLKTEPNVRAWRSGLALAEAIERGEHLPPQEP